MILTNQRSALVAARQRRSNSINAKWLISGKVANSTGKKERKGSPFISETTVNILIRLAMLVVRMKPSEPG